MVFPPSAADDESASREVDWIKQIKLGLRLTRAGILVHVDHAQPARLGELVRGLAQEHPEVDVFSDVRVVETIAEGSVVVLLPRAEDAKWLNVHRPVFARRALRVVLFCDRETTIALAEHAVDFFDWISQHHVCPEGPPLHAVLGLRAAAAAQAPGIAWLAEVEDQGDVDRLKKAFSAAFTGKKLRWIRPERDYAQILEKLRSKSRWIAARVHTHAHAWQFRWALAETKRRRRVIASTTLGVLHGYWPVHDRLMSFEQARDVLAQSGAERSGALAALTDLEPEAIDLARRFVEHGMKHAEFVALLAPVSDAGAALAERAHAAGWINMESIATFSASPPELRALASLSEVQTLRQQVVREVRKSVQKNERVPLERLALWALHDETPITMKKWPTAAARGSLIIEKLVRQDLDPQAWADVSVQAAGLGAPNPASLWALRSIERAGKMYRTIANALALNMYHGSRRIAELKEVQRVQHRRWKLIRNLGNLAIAVFGVVFVLLALSFNGWYLLGVTALFLVASILAISGWDWYSSPFGESSSFKTGWFYLIFVLALLNRRRGRYRLAQRTLDDLRKVMRNTSGAQRTEHRDVLRALVSLLVDLGENDQAKELLDEVIQLEGRVGAVHETSFISVMIDLAILTQRDGAIRESGLILDKLLPSDALEPRETSVEIHWGSATTSKYLNQFLSTRDPIEIPKPRRTRTLHARAQWLMVQGRYEEVEALVAKAGINAPDKIRIVEVDTLDLLGLRAGVLWDSDMVHLLALRGGAAAFLGRYDEGVRLVRGAVMIGEGALGPNHVETARLLLQLARVEARQEKDLARQTARRAIAAFADAECSPKERAAALDELRGFAS